jgi:peptide subunit release factor 1 (eRF1)
LYSATHFRLSKVSMLHLLDELKDNSITVCSLYIPPGSSKDNAAGMMETLIDASMVKENIAEYITDSPTGAVLFWGSQHRYLVFPPFPFSQEKLSNTCEIEPLYSLLNKEFLIGLVLIRLGAYGIGVFEGESLVSSKVGTGLVHARHRQGGSSSHRFERHREKQMESFFTRVCEHAREQLEPYARQLEYVIYGGTKETILDFRKQCHFMHGFDKRTLDLLLNIREPKQAGLEQGIREAWSSRVIRWNE